MSTPRNEYVLDASAGGLLPSAKSSHVAFTVIPIAARLFANHLLKLYQDFDGDLVMALVFSEVSQRNMCRVLQLLAAQQKHPPQSLEAILERVEKERIMPCNALSIAEATGIPRETVRRKVAELELRGWVSRPQRNMLLITPKSVERLFGRAGEMVDELLASARDVQRILDQKDATRVAEK